VALAVAIPVSVLARILRPLLVALGLGERLGDVALPVGALRMREDELRVLANVGDDAEPIEEDEREMIAGIFGLGDTKVREVMVPRIDIVAIPLDATLDDALDTIIAAGHSRIPVHRESIDDIAGLLYAKDLLRAYRQRDFEPDLGSMLRPAYFIPESKPVDELLEELQTRKVHMAVVVDEYGGTAGIVTIEDLIEEIVGEIQDEYDREEPRIELLNDDEGLFDAGVDIDDVNRLMDIDLPTDEVDTLAGLVFTSLGRVPDVGDRARFDAADIVVLAVVGRRIKRVRVVCRRGEMPTVVGEPAPLPSAEGTRGAEGGVPTT
jgi:CBS domain containing-hemolysin-like protein